MEVADQLFEETANRARVCVNGGKFGQAYALFLFLLKLKPDRKGSLEEEFCDIWYAWSSELIRLNKPDKMVELYYTGCECFNECERFHMITGKWFYRLRDKLRAHSTFKYILELNENNIEARQNLDNLCRSIIRNWHYDMLNDAGRNQTFYNAIMDSISSISSTLPKDVPVKIIDIGSGTGLLSMFSCMNVNATSVVACECDEVMAKLGKDVIHGNGFEGRITFFHCYSTQLSLEEGLREIPFKGRADLVISEIIDVGVFGEGIITSIDHAWRELLIPQEKGGVVIPSKAIIKVTCVECEQIHNEHCANIGSAGHPILAVSNVGIEGNPEGLNGHWHPMVSAQEPYTCGRIGDLTHKKLMNYEELKAVNFNSAEEMAQLSEAEGVPFYIKLTSLTDGYLDAVITSFDLFLSHNHVLNTHIGSEGCWEQCIYPIRCLTQVDDVIEFSRIFVRRNSTIMLNFLQYFDKIELDNCVITNMSETKVFPQRNPFQSVSTLGNVQILSLYEADLIKVNDLSFLEFFHKSIDLSGVSRQCNTTRECTNQIIDLHHGEPLLALCIATKFLMTSVNICRIEEKYQKSEYFLDYLQKPMVPNFVWTELRPGLNFVAAIIDAVEHSGLLSESIFMSIVENRRLLHPDGYFFPCKLKIMAQVIQSEQLVKRCMIPEKSATIGVEIGTHLHPFRPSTLSHLIMHNIMYKTLSQPFICEEIDFKHCSAKRLNENKLNISIDIDKGTVHGILIWYVLVGFEDLTFDTLDPANSCRQCVFMNGYNPLEVSQGHSLSLVYWRKSSYISFDFLNE